MKLRDNYNLTPLTLKRMISHLEPRFQKIEEELQKIHHLLSERENQFKELVNKLEGLEKKHLLSKDK